MKLNFWAKLNLVLLIAALFGIAVLAYWVVNQKDKYINVEILSSENNTQPSWLVNSIKVGSKETDFAGKNIAEVTAIETHEQGSYMDILLNVKLSVEQDDIKGTYRFKQKTLEVGNIVTLSLDNSTITGSVISINGQGEAKNNVEYKKVRVGMFFKRPWLADAIKVGDKETSTLSNSVTSEVLSKKVENAIVSIQTNLGKVIVTNDPRFRDIVLELKLKVEVRNGVPYYANNQLIKVNNKLWVPMQKYNIYEAEIMSVEDMNEN